MNTLFCLQKYDIIYSVQITKRVEYITKLDTNLHSVFSLNYHLVLVVKYRRKVLDEPISNRLREIFEYIAPSYKIAIIEWNHDIDHIHILFKAEPKTEISKFINAYKSDSSRLIDLFQNPISMLTKAQIKLSLLSNPALLLRY